MINAWGISMKILAVSHEYPPIGGGGANACMCLAKEYAAKGHKIDIVTVRYADQEYVEKLGDITIYRVKAKRKHVEHCSFVEMLDYLIKAVPVVNKLAKSEEYDICQVFFGIPSGPIGYYLKKKFHIPYVIRFGGGDIPGFQDRFSGIYKLLGPAIRRIWDYADALVANSMGLRQLAEGFYAKNAVSVIPNGAYEQETDSANRDVAGDDTINLLFVSRLIERKGLQDILGQFSTVRENCRQNGRDIKLHIVGDGPYRNDLETIVAQNGIDDMTVFHGQKDKNDLPRYYRDADVFLFPSRKEGMPNVVLEAMSFGLPVIMTPCQGSEELIDGNGFVCEASDFGDKIIELVCNDDLRRDCSEKSRIMVRERFSWERTSEKYLELFETVAAK